MAINLEDFELIPADNDDPHFVYVQHGSHGKFADMAFLANVMISQCGFTEVSNVEVAKESGPMPRRVLYHTDANEGWFRTDYGLAVCSDRAYPDLKAALEAFISTHTDAECIRFSALGHSYGGIIIRDVVSRIRAEPSLARLQFTVFATIATPHLGVRQIAAPLRYGGMLMGQLNVSASYAELFLMGPDGGPLATTLLDEEHLAALEAFERRYLVGAANKDPLVYFPTSTLCFEGTRKSFADGEEPVTKHMLMAIPLNRGDIDWNETEHVRCYPAPGSDLLCGDGFDSESVETRIATTLRRRMDFVVVPIKSYSWYPSAHTTVVSSRRRFWEAMMDDVSYALAGLFVSQGTRWPSVKR